MQGKLEPSSNTKIHVLGGPINHPEEWWIDQWDGNDENDVRVNNYSFELTTRLIIFLFQDAIKV